MYDRLKDLIAQGDMQEALYELQEEYVHIEERTREEAASLCILEASIWEQLGDGQAELRAIEKGLNYDGSNYELFFMLGVYYNYINVNKAYLCYEMAAHYCNVPEDKEAIVSEMEAARANTAFRVRGISIMILSYNDLELTRRCIEAVEKYQPEEGREIVVVDNNSSEEGVWEYLKEKEKSSGEGFKLALLDTNLGFPAGCNMGVLMARDDNDIFFLNNDAVVTPNAIFWLRMGLYENRNTGAVGAVSNSAQGQDMGKAFFEEAAGRELPEDWHRALGIDESIDIFKKTAERNVRISVNSLVRRYKLIGFAVLVSRDAIKEVAPDGKVFDERFFPGYFEDDDLGVRIALADFDQYLCTNAFVYHQGGSGFAGHSDAMEANREKFIEKWGFDSWSYVSFWDEAVSLVADHYFEKKRPLRILDLSCGLGATAARIKQILPDAFVAGVCRNSFAAAIAGHMADEVTFGDPNLCDIPWKDYSFDVVIGSKEEVSKPRAMQCLVPGGIYINEEGVKHL